MSRNGSHSCAGAVLQDGTELPCICMRCKNDNVDCCFAHEMHLVCPDFGPQTCPDFEPEEEYEPRGNDGHGWISVKDRLPPDEAYVLICTRSKNGARNIDKGYCIQAEGRWATRGTAMVTHWMPLPELPEEDDDDKKT